MWLTAAQKPTPKSQSQFQPSGQIGSRDGMPEPLARSITGRHIRSPVQEVWNCMVTGMHPGGNRPGDQHVEGETGKR